MNKVELINAAADKASLTKTDMGKALEAILEVIIETLPNDKITLKGFGTFETVPTKERTCRNPQSGEKVNVPAGHKAKWKPSDNIKNAVKGQ